MRFGFLDDFVHFKFQNTKCVIAREVGNEGEIAKRRELASVGSPESEYELRRQPWLFCVRCEWKNSKEMSYKIISHVLT